jgi:superfamily I DNA and RNA helicase
MEVTLKAMKRVLEIRQVRQRRFIKNRLAPDWEKQKEENLKEIEKNLNLIMAPMSKKSKQVENLIKEVKESEQGMELE